MKKALVVLCLTLISLSAGAKSRPVEGIVNLNAASAEELTLLPGIGPSKAQAIVAYREAHPFKAVSELVEVQGIGPKMVEKLQPFLAVEGPTTLHEVREEAPPAAKPAK